jgi:protein required for attachment to host cells
MTRRHAVPVAKHAVTWILVADGKQAQVYVRERVERRMPPSFAESISHEPMPVADMCWEAESADQYQVGRNATGMVFSSGGSARHMSEPHMDARAEVKQHLAVLVAGELDMAKAQKRFDRLVLVAPPKMLGEIKKHLGKAVLKSVVAELPKELTHYEGAELLEHLQGVLQPSA